MLPLSQAQELVLNSLPSLLSTLVPLDSAQGFPLFQSVTSPDNIPRFDNSAMDGYAICVEKNWTLPLALKIVDFTIGAGDTYEQTLGSGQAIRIMTGAPVPDGANAVVPIEVVEVQDKLLVVKQFNQIGQHIRPAGEDFKQGQTLLDRGHIINPGTIGLLATLGVTEVPLIQAPNVAILSTGNELVSIDQLPSRGQIRDSNSHALAASVRELKAIPQLMGIVEDTKAALKQQLQLAFEKSDIILTLGGVSVGDYDYVQEVLLELGFEKHFWKVAVKPGKPVLFGTWKNKMVFGLPGNPGSALTIFEYLVRPAIRKMMGYPHLWRPQVQAQLLHPIHKKGDRLHLMRANAWQDEQGRYQVSAQKSQGSANLLIVSQANAIIRADCSYDEGELVTIDLIRQDEDH